MLCDMSICNFGCLPLWGLKAGLKLVLIAPAPERCLPFTFCLTIPDKIRNATRRTDQLSGRSQVMGQFRLYLCIGMSGTAAIHIVCNQASKCVQEN